MERKLKMTPVLMINLPTCQFCSEKACYDAKTIYFSWAYMCGYHYLVYGIKSTGIKLKKVREQK